MDTVLGVQVAQVRIIFTLLHQFQVGMYSQALAYVEWFTPLQEPELSSGLCQVSRLTRQLHQNAAAIYIDEVIHPLKARNDEWVRARPDVGSTVLLWTQDIARPKGIAAEKRFLYRRGESWIGLWPG
jgi:hypothetical protein